MLTDNIAFRTVLTIRAVHTQVLAGLLGLTSQDESRRAQARRMMAHSLYLSVKTSRSLIVEVDALVKSLPSGDASKSALDALLAELRDAVQIAESLASVELRQGEAMDGTIELEKTMARATAVIYKPDDPNA